VSGKAFQTHGMVRHVFMKVCEDQQELEHPVSLHGIWVVCLLFQAFDNRQRVGKQPLESLLTERLPLTAATEGLIGANESLVEKVIEAKLLAHETERNRVGTSTLAATCRNSGCHYPPRALAVNLPARHVSERLPYFSECKQE
jgi:hypothetical protein